MSKVQTTVERFWERVDSSGDCWLWAGGLTAGRPSLYVGPKGCIQYAHRFSWELHNGPVGDAMLVKRSCGNGLCVRPEHLHVVPRKQVGTRTPATRKRCRQCGEVKGARAFQRKAQKVDGLESYCRECNRTRQREANLRKYGITQAEYEELLAQQLGVCAVCGIDPSPGRLSVDHDHTTGAVRGLLCNGCNSAAGQSGDDPVRLRALADYLEAKV